jgi:hypothetical protein
VRVVAVFIAAKITAARDPLKPVLPFAESSPRHVICVVWRVDTQDQQGFNSRIQRCDPQHCARCVFFAPDS